MRLHLNLDRQRARRQADTLAALNYAAGASPPDHWFDHLADDPAEAARMRAEHRRVELLNRRRQR